MKRNIIPFAKCAVLLLLTGVAWSCSKDEVEEILSTETTPVTFLVDAKTTPIFFDYTEGWRYISSDTVQSNSIGKYSINLHQGKHNIVAVKGIDLSVGALKTGIHFNPENHTFYLRSEHDGAGLYDGVDTPDLGVAQFEAYYWHRSLEVSQYLLPEQQPTYTAVTATLQIVITDYNNRNILPNQTFSWTGSITNMPVVEEMKIGTDEYYKLRDQPHKFYVGLSRQGEHGIYPIITYQYITLCPQEGLENINLKCSMTDENGQTVLTTPLPIFSLRRGFKTILRGPLFSGSASDWTKEMLPYEQ